MAVQRHQQPRQRHARLTHADQRANLLAGASDQDGDALIIASANRASANGGSVWLTNAASWFAPAPGFVGVDQWSYALADARGGSVSGLVSVTVISSNSVTLIPVS